MKKTWIEAALAGGVILLVVLFYVINPLHTDSRDPRLRVYGFATFRAPSVSMEPSLPENSIFLVSAWPYFRSEPRVGDVVVFKYPPDPSVEYVKRIIATGGASVEISKGVVLVDGRPIAESYLKANASPSYYSREMLRVRVPAGSFFVMGDNRDHSADSRVWGFLPRDHIVGRVETILLGGPDP